MKTKKTKIKLLTMCILILTLSFGFVGCESEEILLKDAQIEDAAKGDNKLGKIDVCHYSYDDDKWFVININENAWPDHMLHGDVWLDQDGDGSTVYNECGIGDMTDCDDTNPEVYLGAPELCNNVDNNCDGVVNDRYNTIIHFQGFDYYGAAGYAIFGPGGTVSGEWVDINDILCEPTTEDFTGKIVFINRGTCYFVDKIKNAQDQGAIGVIIRNSIGFNNMSAPPGYDISQITIPSIMTSAVNCGIIQTEQIVSFTLLDDCGGTANKLSVNNVNKGKALKTYEVQNIGTFDN